MMVWITRDDHIFFRSGAVTLTALPKRIQEHLKDRGVERKVYIAADMGVHWGTVKQVLDGARSAGVLRVAFLAY
jgi:biopolymer transport protein ExbD